MTGPKPSLIVVVGFEANHAKPVFVKERVRKKNEKKTKKLARFTWDLHQRL
jgi:hypothetical protein